MATTLNRALVLKEEASYATYTAPDTAIEFLADGTIFTNDPVIVQGQGTRAGALVANGGRRVVVKQDGTGSIPFEALSRGQGKLWKWMMGSSVSTLVSGTTYQQIHTIGETLASFVAQEQHYRIAADGTFTAAPYSWLGCMVSDFEIGMGAELCTVKANVNIAKLDTGQSAVAVTLPNITLKPFHKGNLTAYTGTMTAPTTTTLGSGTSELGGIVEITISVNNNLNTERPGAAGVKGKPVAQLRTISVKITAEHRDNSWEVAHAAQTALALVATYTGEALSSGTETLQVMITDLRIDKAPKKIDGGVPMIEVEASGTWGSDSVPPMYVVLRTADSAI